MDSLFLTWQSILGLLAFLFLCKSWVARVARGKETGLNLPPEPAGAWPVVGHLPLLTGAEVTARTLARMADDYGPAITLRLGVHRTLVVSSWELAKECFTTNDRALASRPPTAAFKYLAYDYVMLGFAPYGPLWRELRKIATVELLSSGRLEKLRHVRAEEVGGQVRELYRLWAMNGRCSPVRVEMKQWFEDVTFNVMVRMLVGKRCFSSGGGATEDGVGGDVRQFQKATTRLMYLAGVFVPSDAVPWLEWLDLQGYIKAMKTSAKELDSVMVAWLEEHRRKRLLSGGVHGEKDFMDVLLSVVDDADLSGCDPDTVIKATTLALVIGGSDTSSVAMTWALALLLNHPRVLEKVHDELDLCVGRDRNVDESDVRDLVYLHAVVKETLRLYPIAPFSIPHMAIEECRIAGYHVPTGTRLLTNIWKIHRDPRVWSDPDEFQPERFLSCGSAADLDVRGKDFGYLPFGSGRRMCPGITSAMQVMQLTLARLVHGFDLSTSDGDPVDMREDMGLTITKRASMDVILTPHLPSRLYE